MRRSTRCPHGFERSIVPCESCGDRYNVSAQGVVHINRLKPKKRVRIGEAEPEQLEEQSK